MEWTQHKLPGAVLEVGTVNPDDKPVVAEIHIRPTIPFRKLAETWAEAQTVLEREYGGGGQPPDA